ncbi:hypothetical protein TNCV_1700871 [Trichonephila clavipes]|nr:hypothetical protein TNCV_1700871 [Trichonephila clavipes]
MARKKSQANQHRKRIDKFTSPDRTSHATMRAIAHVESHNPTPSRPASTPAMDKDNFMELTLPPSTNNSRLGMPQDSHCRRRLALNEELKGFTLAIQATQVAIKDYKDKRVTGGFLIDHQQQLQDVYRNDLQHVVIPTSREDDRFGMIGKVLAFVRNGRYPERTFLPSHATSNSEAPQQMAPQNVTVTATSQPTIQAIITSIHNQQQGNNTKNGCLNLITQTLQQTIEAFSSLVQQINLMNISEREREIPPSNHHH